MMRTALVICFCALTIAVKAQDTVAVDATTDSLEVSPPTIPVQPPEPFIRAIQMNILYRGIDNPVSISVPGYPDSLLQISASNCTFSGTGKRLLVKPGRGSRTVIFVHVLQEGTPIEAGKYEFRVKPIPNPIPYFAASCYTDTIKGFKLRAAQGVIAKMEYFEFDVKFTVTEFTMTAWVNNQPTVMRASNTDGTRGNRVTTEMKKFIAEQKPDRIDISEVKAIGPDGYTRNLAPIFLVVQW
ncbi:MAG: GldM family protein [Salibacteraceae bacterium]